MLLPCMIRAMISSNRQQILKGCDQCVLCGLCLPHCPTYQIENSECESPRGRIVLIQALMRRNLDSQKIDLSTLEHCLLCRSCEAVCPSKVPYGEMMTLTRDVLQPKQSKLVAQLMDTVAEPQQMQKMLSRLKLYKKSGLQKLIQANGLLGGLLKGEFRAAEGLLKFSSSEKLQDYYPAKSESQGDVQLFVGCMGESFDQQTVRDAIALLNGLGFGVQIDHPASCCGAMHHHNGDVKKGAELKAASLSSLSNSNRDFVVGLAGSCVARLLEGKGEGNGAESPSIIEITDFLVANLDRLTEGLSAANKKVAVHQPCSSKNLLKNFDRTMELLNKIPALELLMLPTYGCCGASGIHMVSDAEHARKFLRDTVEWLAVEKPDLIVSQNMGCMFHIASEMERQNMGIEVIHPVSLLRSALADKIY